jgi:hypothetical protein
MFVAMGAKALADRSRGMSLATGERIRKAQRGNLRRITTR